MRIGYVEMVGRKVPGTGPDAVAAPDVAAMVAVPLLTAVTTPPDTVATAEFEDAHVTGAPAITAPF